LPPKKIPQVNGRLFFRDRKTVPAMPIGSHGATPPIETRKQIEILVVESNPADARLTLEAFKEAGLTSDLRSVRDGEDALLYVRGEGQYKNVPIPDLIFLDLSVPTNYSDVAPYGQ
jgi:hypothetical protein